MIGDLVIGKASVSVKSIYRGEGGGCLDVIPDCLPGSTTEVDNTEYKI